jgi:putative DNA primase/helicase
MATLTNNNSNEIQNLKSNIDIVTVADDLGCLPPKQGSIFQGGRCPTGHESQGGKCFTIYLYTQNAYCFHCGKSWDAIALVEDIKGLDFISACNWLSRQYNLPYLKTKDMTPEEKAVYQSKLKEQKIIFDILTDAARYHHESLMTDKEMINHLTAHYGLSGETISTYALGYSTGAGLLKHLQKLGYSIDDIVKTGLFVKVGSKWKEFFQHRLIFPYWKSGQVIYFIGRKTDRTSDKTCEQAKYKKLPTKNENRSYISEVIGNQWFYGEDSIRGAETVFVAEGVTDCLAMLQAGYSTISPVTVRFRAQDQEHLNRLTRRAKTIYLVPDNETNEAGIKGALDTAGKLEEAGKSVYIVKLPLPEEQEKIDVADILRDYGKEKLEELIKAAKTPLQIEIDQISAEGLDLIMLSDRLKPIEEKLAGMTEIKRAAHIQYMKKTLDLPGDFMRGLSREVNALNAKNQQDVEPESIVEVVEPWKTAVEGQQLLNNISEVIKSHIVLDSHSRVACSLWVLLTYTYDAFRILPMLGVTSPEKRCGKTTLLEVVEGLVNKPLLASNISPSAFFRSIEKYQPCIIVDEADTFIKNNDELRGIINSGHTRRSAFVIRTNTETLEPERFSTWGPKIISMIGDLPDTNKDRSIVIRMKRKAPGEKTGKVNLDFNDQHLILRRKSARWAQDHFKSLAGSELDTPNVGNDRATDNWTPLIAIADIIGGDWPTLAREAMVNLEEASDDDTAREQLLKDIKEIFKGQGDKIFSKLLVGKLVELEDRPWADWRKGKPLTQNALARLLKPFEISSKSVRIDDKTAKGYSLEQFEDAFQRYLAYTKNHVPPFQSVTTSQINDINGSHENQSVTQEKDVTLLNRCKPVSIKGCDVVTVQKGGGDTQGNYTELEATEFEEGFV